MPHAGAAVHDALVPSGGQDDVVRFTFRWTFIPKNFPSVLHQEPSAERARRACHRRPLLGPSRETIDDRCASWVCRTRRRRSASADFRFPNRSSRGPACARRPRTARLPPHRATRVRSASCCRRSRIPGDEILNVNIWAPTDAASGRTPVMVWMHGGSLKHGPTPCPATTARVRPRRDRLRLRQLPARRRGFLGPRRRAPEPRTPRPARRAPLGATGDRRVRRRPGSVTVFGQSAGGATVAALAASPSRRGHAACHRDERAARGEVAAADAGRITTLHCTGPRYPAPLARRSRRCRPTG